MIILLLLIWFLIYFIIMYINTAYVSPVVEETTVAEESKAPAVYDLYSNPHEITTTPDYSVDEAKRLLKQFTIIGSKSVIARMYHLVPFHLITVLKL